MVIITVEADQRSCRFSVRILYETFKGFPSLDPKSYQSSTYLFSCLSTFKNLAHFSPLLLIQHNSLLLKAEAHAVRGNKFQEDMYSSLQTTFLSLFSNTAETHTGLAALPLRINKINSWYSCGTTTSLQPSLLLQ